MGKISKLALTALLLASPTILGDDAKARIPPDIKSIAYNRIYSEEDAKKFINLFGEMLLIKDNLRDPKEMALWYDLDGDGKGDFPLTYILNDKKGDGRVYETKWSLSLNTFHPHKPLKEFFEFVGNYGRDLILIKDLRNPGQIFINYLTKGGDICMVYFLKHRYGNPVIDLEKYKLMGIFSDKDRDGIATGEELVYSGVK